MLAFAAVALLSTVANSATTRDDPGDAGTQRPSEEAAAAKEFAAEGYPRTLIDRPLTLPSHTLALSLSLSGEEMWLDRAAYVRRALGFDARVAYALTSRWELAARTSGYAWPWFPLDAASTELSASYALRPESLAFELALPLPLPSPADQSFVEGLAVGATARPRLGRLVAIYVTTDLLVFGSGKLAAPGMAPRSSHLAPELKGVRQTVTASLAAQISEALAVRAELPSLFGGTVFQQALAQPYFGLNWSPEVSAVWCAHRFDLQASAQYQAPALSWFSGSVFPATADLGVDPSSRWRRNPGLLFFGWSRLAFRLSLLVRI